MNDLLDHAGPRQRKALAVLDEHGFRVVRREKVPGWGVTYLWLSKPRAFKVIFEIRMDDGWELYMPGDLGVEAAATWAALQRLLDQCAADGDAS